MHIVHYAVVVERHQLFSYLVDVFIHRVQVLARVLSILDMDQPVDLIFNFNLFFVEFHAVFTPIEKVVDLSVKICLSRYLLHLCLVIDCVPYRIPVLADVRLQALRLDSVLRGPVRDCS